MFNVQTKLISVMVGIATIATSCTTNSVDEIDARNLLAQSRSDFENCRFDHAILLLDSIDNAYPKAVETRREVRMLRPQIIEQQSARELSKMDSLMVVNSIKGDSLKSCFTFVSNPVEGYYVSKSTGAADVNKVAGLHTRISPDYHFYMMASCPQAIKSISVAVSADGVSVSSPSIAFDGERNARHGKCEIITFTEAETAPIAKFISDHGKSPITITFNGESGKSYSMILGQTQKDALVGAYGLIMAVNSDKTYRLEKERLQRQLEIARRKLAEVADK